MDQREWRTELITNSAEDTREIGVRLGRLLRGGEVVALTGDLGSGKTTFAKGLSQGLGLADTRQVCSPTYVLEHVYAAHLPIHHYDAYRLESPLEFADLGFEEHIRLGGRVLIIEWADRVAEVLPDNRLNIDFEFCGTTPTPSESAGGGAVEESRRIAFSGLRIFWDERLNGLKFPAPPGR